jgi:hypothetical protein
VKNLIFVLFLLVVVFAVAGYFLGWYQITDLPTGTTGQHRLQIDINTTKIRDDLHRGSEKVQEGIDRVRQGAEKKDATAQAETPKAKDPGKKAEGSFFEFLDRIGEKSRDKR